MKKERLNRWNTIRNEIESLAEEMIQEGEDGDLYKDDMIDLILAMVAEDLAIERRW